MSQIKVEEKEEECVREKVLSWDPPAWDFLLLISHPTNTFFFLPQRNLSWVITYSLRIPKHCTSQTFTDQLSCDLPHMHNGS